MRVLSLELTGFRNLLNTAFLPGQGVNVIAGDNAQGKTNLLEALWLFSGLRSFRAARDADYVAFGGESARLGLSFFAGGREQTASISLMPPQKKVALNEIPLERRGSLSGSFAAVVFSPDHLELVKQGPGSRRRLIDSSLCQAYPKYGAVVLGYEKILRQRRAVLSDIPKNPGLIDMLEVWDKGLTEYGGYITFMRERYINRLSAYARDAYSGIASGSEEISLIYRAGAGETKGLTERGEYISLVKDAVKSARAQDLRLGRTTAGPHLDDIEILVNGKAARAFGSQGQQRSCVLAIKLAECRILEEGAGEPPVILLDDVMSELDEGRRGYLLNHLTGRQVFITCCDPGQLAGLKGGRVFMMKSGELAQLAT
ncbi:MAG: DNA replication/repair protein RecF [Oscillospiraceae bacterium]|nr:DNA replication/repair protein RecF [Oscillospiraceae bacterium]